LDLEHQLVSNARAYLVNAGVLAIFRQSGALSLHQRLVKYAGDYEDDPINPVNVAGHHLANAARQHPQEHPAAQRLLKQSLQKSLKMTAALLVLLLLLVYRALLLMYLLLTFHLETNIHYFDIVSASGLKT
jgi:hypothetical protein